MMRTSDRTVSDWLTNWEDCSNETIRDFEEIYQRLAPTKVYYRDKLRYQVDADPLSVSFAKGNQKLLPIFLRAAQH